MCMTLETRPQAAIFDTNRVPTPHQERQMVEGLKAAWTLPKGDVIYAHPERFNDGVLTGMISEGKASVVALHENQNVLGWAALVKHPGIGNIEIGSVNASRGMGTPLVEEIYKDAEGNPDQDILFFDVATCRTAMEGAAIKAADRTGLRIPVVTYVDPPVWGDGKRGITWGAFGLFAISKSYLEAKGPLELPKLPETDSIQDGTEEIIGNVMKTGNIEGAKRGVTVFGSRKEEKGKREPFDSSVITDGLVLVDYFNTERRRELTSEGFKPCGIEIGRKGGELTMGVHYSPHDPRESAHGRHTDLVEMDHPTRTITETTAFLAESIRIAGNMNPGVMYSVRSV